MELCYCCVKMILSFATNNRVPRRLLQIPWGATEPLVFHSRDMGEWSDRRNVLNGDTSQNRCAMIGITVGRVYRKKKMAPI